MLVAAHGSTGPEWSRSRPGRAGGAEVDEATAKAASAAHRIEVEPPEATEGEVEPPEAAGDEGGP